MNEQNLKPQNTRTKSEQREIARKGGIASGKKRAEKKLLKDILETALSTKSDKNTPNGDKYLDIVIGLIKEAEKGNPKAFEVVRDTIGQKPIEQVQNINPPQIVIERPKE